METGIGISNPLFFIGVVENNEDPRLEGRIQARAFGIHGSIKDIPSEDLPWATCIMGNHDPINIRVPPLNSWVFGFFIDGRDAQQPMILGVIPTQMTEPIDPSKYGWGVSLGDEINRGAHGSRDQDFGQPPGSRLARGEELDKTYILPLETNRVKNIEVAGGSCNISSIGNIGAAGQDDGFEPVITSSNQRDVPVGVNIYGAAALAAANRYNIPPDLFFRLIEQESSWNPNAVSSVGAIGLTQIMPETARDPGFGVAPLKSYSNTDEQLRFGAEYLSALYRRYGDWPRALAAYNSGIGNVDRAGGVPAITETRNYVNKIYGGWKAVGSPTGSLSERYANFTNSSNSSPEQFASVENLSTASSYMTNVSWEEPSSAYNASYPHNRVIETPGGHVIELDSTQNQERIMIWHPSGSYIQMSPSTYTKKSHSDAYDINERNYHMYIGGSNIITIEGDSHVLVKGNKIEEIRGNYQQIIGGNHLVSVAGQMNFIGGENGQIRAGSLNLEANVEQLHLKAAKSLKFQGDSNNPRASAGGIGAGIHIKGQNIFLDADDSVNIKSLANVNIHSGVYSQFTSTLISIDSKTSTDIKSSSIRIGGGDKVSINADIVGIDKIVYLGSDVADNVLPGSNQEIKTPGPQNPFNAIPSQEVFAASPTAKTLPKSTPV
jgi:hypothetical protein